MRMRYKGAQQRQGDKGDLLDVADIRAAMDAEALAIAEATTVRPGRKLGGATRRTGVNRLTGLTVKQENFAQAVHQGMTLTAAYRLAYDTSPDAKPATAWRSAQQIIANPKVQARLIALDQEREGQRKWQSASMAARVIERLDRLADDKAVPYSVRVRALELLGKSVGAFRDVQQVTGLDGKGADALETELKQLLSEAKAAKNVP